MYIKSDGITDMHHTSLSFAPQGVCQPAPVPTSPPLPYMYCCAGVHCVVEKSICYSAFEMFLIEYYKIQTVAAMGLEQKAL